jgi:hypothetical protein
MNGSLGLEQGFDLTRRPASVSYTVLAAGPQHVSVHRPHQRQQAPPRPYTLRAVAGNIGGLSNTMAAHFQVRA